MILVFTGNGKGKTTAALGQAMRAVGEGKRVLMVQFIKGPWKSGEDEAYKALEPNFKIVKKGKGFVGILGDTLPRTAHEAAASEALEYARKEVETGNWHIVILDEINNAVALNLVNVASVLDFMDIAPQHLEHIILTGRDAPQTFIDRADLVTEMHDAKHPFYEGVKAKRGLEY